MTEAERLRADLVRKVVGVDNRPEKAAKELVGWWLDEGRHVHGSWPGSVAALVVKARAAKSEAA